ncbi:hypothetical protein ADMFC3_29850 [Geovibrio sp. ADMFC3]
MNTKWNMVFFMFLGLTGAALLLYASLAACFNKRDKHKYFALSAGISSASASLIILLGLNEFSRMLNILMRPYSGLSTALLMQLAAAFFSFLLFFKGKTSSAVRNISVIVSLAAVFCLARNYMIITRPALNTYLFSAFLIVSAIFAAWNLISINKDLTLDEALTSNAGAVIISVYGLILLIFSLRVGWLEPEDRIFSFAKLIYGSYAPIFWMTVVLSFAVPLAITVFSSVRKKAVASVICCASFAAGIFLLSVLINQMPVLNDSINNRFIF